jgi:hypothetical protein
MSSLIGREARGRLLRMRWSCALVGLTLGLALGFLQELSAPEWSSPLLNAPVALPLILLLALPEIGTGLWLWRADHDRDRGQALFYAFASWGILRWSGWTLAALAACVLVGFPVVSVLCAPDHAAFLVALRVLLGSLTSVGVATAVGVLAQLRAREAAARTGVWLYVGVSVLYAWLRNAYPPPQAVDLVRQTQAQAGIPAYLVALLAAAGCVLVVVLGAGLLTGDLLDFLIFNSWGGVVAFALLLLLLVVSLGVGKVVLWRVGQGRQPTPRDCWGELYPPAGSSGPEEHSPTSPSSPAIRPSLNGSQEKRPW